MYPTHMPSQVVAPEKRLRCVFAVSMRAPVPVRFVNLFVHAALMTVEVLPKAELCMTVGTMETFQVAFFMFPVWLLVSLVIVVQVRYRRRKSLADSYLRSHLLS
jgi:hypothetical protein